MGDDFLHSPLALSQDTLVFAFAEAIAHFEGYYPAPWMLERQAKWPTPARRNNNPGNLRSWGQTPIRDGFARFPTVEKGFQSLHRQIHKNVFIRRLNLLEFFAGKAGVYGGYAPAADNNHPTTYARFVAQFLRDRGLPIVALDTVIADLCSETIH